jgi:hypothetical protein
MQTDRYGFGLCMMSEFHERRANIASKHRKNMKIEFRVSIWGAEVQLHASGL